MELELWDIIETAVVFVIFLLKDNASSEIKKKKKRYFLVDEGQNCTPLFSLLERMCQKLFDLM